MNQNIAYKLSWPTWMRNSYSIALKLVSDIRHWRKQRSVVEAQRDEAQATADSKAQVLANLSHDIREPMISTLGMIDLLGQTQLSDDQKLIL